ncbi:response regulator transcription factor [Aneurinibacillus terranovensis]|uniref:response regulator transcription factor n=1 Tax=Aneurinibacillus terranovensis TaxID=278991 RepID=UPI000429ECCF|nr:response regulator transcription factor [Aneurinibacillus terranovensis]
MKQHNILIVDDEAEMRELIEMYLAAEGYCCQQANDGYEALQRLEKTAVDLVILDVMMPKMDGLATCMKIRETSTIPIIFVTARGEEWDKVNGLKIGADDFVVKPFSPRELVARVEAILRRMQVASPVQEDFQCYGPLQLNLKGRKVYIGETQMSLTLKEFDLLVFFVQHTGQVLSRQQLLEYVWGYEYCGNERTVDTHVKTLRMKLGIHAELIQTIWGVGYKFEV